MQSKKTYINIDHVYKKFTDSARSLSVLEDISCEIYQGEFFTIVGSSGCGKSTLLRIISGLDTDYEGKVAIEGKPVTGPDKSRGIVFQENRLFPWMTVEKNVMFALDEGSRQERKERTSRFINLVGLNGFEQSYPKALSGGMAQRANLARTMVNEPPLLFLDEPFAALDALTKIQMQNELLEIKKREPVTMVMVTHDIEEAVYLSDRILVMSKRPGKVEEILKIDLPRPRDRNDHYFSEYKRKVYNHFFQSEEVVEEYII